LYAYKGDVYNVTQIVSEKANTFSNVTFQQMEEKYAMQKEWLAFPDTGRT
jgi:hypothetical protein